MLNIVLQFERVYTISCVDADSKEEQIEQKEDPIEDVRRNERMCDNRAKLGSQCKNAASANQRRG